MISKIAAKVRLFFIPRIKQANIFALCGEKLKVEMVFCDEFCDSWRHQMADVLAFRDAMAHFRTADV